MAESGAETRTFIVSTLSSVAGSLLLSGATALWQHLHGHSIDWYGILGLFVLAALAFLVLLWVVRRSNQTVSQQSSQPTWKTKDHWRELYEAECAKSALERTENEKLTEEVQQLNLKLDYWQKPWRQYASEEVWKQSIAEQNRLIELGRSMEGVLTSTQIEILRLRRSIIKWFADLPECPVMDATGLEADNADRRTAANSRKIFEWSERIRHAYAIEFAPKVVEVAHKLGLDGIDVRALEARSSSVGTPDQASEIIIELGDLALQAECTK